MHKPIVPAVVAEFLGTFALCFFGILSIVNNNSGLVGVALTHGIALMVFITGAMYVSGGQFNPAVSVALVLAGKQDLRKAGIFIVTQCVASACAAGMVVLIFGSEHPAIKSAGLGSTMGAWQGMTEPPIMSIFLLEMLASFALMFAVLMSTVDERVHKLGGVIIGLTVIMCILAIGPMTGASMNPARTLGPAIYGYQKLLWISLVAPVVGTCLCTLVYRMFWDKKLD